MRPVVLILATLLAACGLPEGPAGQPSSTNVNPVEGSRGGTGAGGGGNR